LASEQRVLDLAREVAARHPRLASRLAPTVAVHVRHVRVLTAALPAPSPAPSPSATPSTPTRGASMKELVAEERRLVALHRASALAARDGELAALLASMGAAAAQQETALR